MVEAGSIDAFILAGGRSSRFGSNKALAQLGGETLIARAARLARTVAPRVTIVGLAKSEHRLDAESIPDQVQGCGPLAAIVTALAHARTEWALVLGCDMPYITPEFLHLLRDRAASAASEIQAIVPETPRGLQPLCALYRKSAAPVFEAALAAKKLKLTSLAATLRLDRVPECEWRAFSREGKLFDSINRPEDLVAARELLQR